MGREVQVVAGRIEDEREWRQETRLGGRSAVDGRLIDTGRRKFGAIIGDGVHTGINTSIYPGRKLWPGTTTRPGDIVQKDIVSPG